MQHSMDWWNFPEKIWGGFDLAEGQFWQWIKALEWLGGTGGRRVTCASRVSLFLFSGEVQGLSSNSSRHPPPRAVPSPIPLILLQPREVWAQTQPVPPWGCLWEDKHRTSVLRDIPSPSSVPTIDTKHWGTVALGAWRVIYPMFSSCDTKPSYLSLLHWKVPP